MQNEKDNTLSIPTQLVLKNATLAIVYATVGGLFALFSTVSPVYLPTGIAVVALLWGGYRLWPGVWLGSCWVLYSAHHDILLGVSGATGTALQVLFSAWILQKFTKTKLPFYRVSDVLIFFFAGAFLACLISATLETATLFFFGFVTHENYPMAWLNGWLSDALGVITMVTVMMPWYQGKITLTVHTLFEIILLFFMLGCIAWIAFHYNWPAYVLFLFCMGSAIRFNVRITALVCLAISAMAVYGALHGYRGFQGVDVNQTMLLTQSFITMTFFIALLLHAILAEREKTQEALIKINQDLEHRVVKRTQDLAEKNDILDQTIAHLKQAQAQLVQEKKMSALGVLAAGVAHEINDSVNFISVNINALKKNIDDIIHILQQYMGMTIDNTLEDQLQAITQLIIEVNLNYTLYQTNKLFAGMKEGTERAATIVKDLRN